MSAAGDALSSDLGRELLKHLVSREDDLSDVSIYHQQKNPAAVTDYTLLDVADGPKTCMQLCGFGWQILTTAGDGNRLGPVTIDGVANSDYPSATGYFMQDDTSDYSSIFSGFPFRYDSSLRIEWEHSGSGYNCGISAYILGSGPHSVAVVKDGEPIYMTAENLSEETIEGMKVPNGYRVVRTEIDHPNPQTRGMWDDDKERVVDHPYFKDFHDTLDELDRMARRTGVQDVLDKIDEKPTSFEGVFKEGLPREDPIEEAVQFWYERESEESTSLRELEKLRG